MLKKYMTIQIEYHFWKNKNKTRTFFFLNGEIREEETEIKLISLTWCFWFERYNFDIFSWFFSSGEERYPSPHFWRHRTPGWPRESVDPQMVRLPQILLLNRVVMSEGMWCWKTKLTSDTCSTIDWLKSTSPMNQNFSSILACKRKRIKITETCNSYWTNNDTFLPISAMFV